MSKVLALTTDGKLTYYTITEELEHYAIIFGKKKEGQSKTDWMCSC